MSKEKRGRKYISILNQLSGGGALEIIPDEFGAGENLVVLQRKEQNDMTRLN